MCACTCICKFYPLWLKIKITTYFFSTSNIQWEQKSSTKKVKRKKKKVRRAREGSLGGDRSVDCCGKVGKGWAWAHLLVTKVEGFFAPVPVKLQDTNQITNCSDNWQTQNRLDTSPWFQSSTFGKSLILENVNIIW